MKHLVVEEGNTIWDVVNAMKANVTVIFPSGCYLRKDGKFDIIFDYYDPEEDSWVEDEDEDD